MHIKDSFPELYKIRRPLKATDVRERLSKTQGKEYWRSLEELAATEEFDEFLHREFPQHAAEWDEGTDRRTFLKLMGASLALAGLSGCAYQPPETYLPYVRDPENVIPGKPLFFATAMPFAGAATGLLVRSDMGRPTKIEGNPDHPASLGATDLYAQASVLSLYDPDRSQTLNYRGEIRSYTAFLADLRTALEGQRAKQGAGIRFLTGTVTSPTMKAQFDEISRLYPGARWHQYEPAGTNAASVGARLAFGTFVNTIYNFAAADRVLALDSDFLSCGPASLRYAKDFATRRRLAQGATTGGEMNRLYVVESTPTNTGVFADHRLSLRPSEMEAFARALSAALGAASAAPPAGAPAYTAHAEWIAACARDLQAHRGRSIVIAGDEQSPVVHALAHAMNQALGNVGTTVSYTEPVEEFAVDQTEDFRTLVSDIDAGLVQMLVIVGGNPVYNAPADLRFDKDRLAKVALRIHLSLYEDETSEFCHWHIPETHYLESWSDARAFDGTVTIIQPLIAPLYNGRSVHEFLAAFTDRPERSSYDIVRDYWQSQNIGGGGSDFEANWRRAVHNGVVPNTARPAKTVALRPELAANILPSPPASGMEIVFRPDPTIYDGRFANNGWLQELPKPLTKLTWDTALLISPTTASRLGIGVATDDASKNQNDYTLKGKEGYTEVVEVRFKGRAMRVPAWIMPGQPDEVVTLHLGYGRWRAGRVAEQVAYPAETAEQPANFQNAYAIRTSDARWAGGGVEVVKTGETYKLASTQIHFNMEDREIVREGTLEEYKTDPALRPHRDEKKQPPARRARTANRSKARRSTTALTIRKTPTAVRAATSGAWSSTSRRASGAARASSRASRRTTFRSSAKNRSRAPHMHWLRIDAYFQGLEGEPRRRLLHARAVYALRERAVRAGLPRSRHRP